MMTDVQAGSGRVAPRVGDWMTTYTGRQFWPIDPRVEDIDLVDIAHALAMLCRFAGHVKEFYSVAEHSVRVAKEVMNRLASVFDLRERQRAGAAALLHDASEAYLVDIPRPLKRQPEMQGYRVAEARLESVIWRRFDLLETYARHAQVIRQVDTVMLRTEMRDLMAPLPAPFDPLGAQIDDLGAEPLRETIMPLVPYQAEARFLKMAHELGVA